MIIRTLAISLAVACSLGACTAVAPEPEPRPDLSALATAEAAAAAVERVVEPTAEMLAAARAGDPEEMQRAAATSLSGCPAPTTCPTTYGSCTTWSAPSQCNFTCTPSLFCSCPFPEHPEDPPCEPTYDVSLGRTTFSSFRVCFNSAQQACTEWKTSINTYCGC